MAQIIDTHTHFFDPQRPQGVPWPNPDNPDLYRTTLPEHFLDVAAGHGVTHTVVVEASSWLEDNQWILDLADDPELMGRTAIAGFVGNVRNDDVDFRRHLDRFGAHPLFRGIRLGNDAVTGRGRATLVDTVRELARPRPGSGRGAGSPGASGPDRSVRRGSGGARGDRPCGPRAYRRSGARPRLVRGHGGARPCAARVLQDLRSGGERRPAACAGGRQLLRAHAGRALGALRRRAPAVRQQLAGLPQGRPVRDGVRARAGVRGTAWRRGRCPRLSGERHRCLPPARALR